MSLAFSVGGALPASAQDTLWTRAFGGPQIDAASSLDQTSDGGYVLAGLTMSFGAGGADFYVVKTEASGDHDWSQTYGGLLDDRARSVQQTSDGGYIVGGGAKSFGAEDSDFLVVKLDASGEPIWEWLFGGPGYDLVRVVRQTADGGYILTGRTESFGAGPSDLYLAKLDADGDTVWTRTFGGGASEQGRSVHQTADGGYIVAGGTSSFGAGSMDFYLIRTDASGDTLWTRTYGGPEFDRAHDMQPTRDGGYILVGYTLSFGAGDYDFYLVKTDASGDTLWTRTFGGPGHDEPFSVQQTKDGGYIITGNTDSFGAGEFDVYVVKTDPWGNLVWSRTYGGYYGDVGRAIQQTPNEGYVIGGHTQSFGSGKHDFFLVRLVDPDLIIRDPYIVQPVLLDDETVLRTRFRNASDDSPVAFLVNTAYPYITVYPESGVLAPGASVDITITLDGSQLDFSTNRFDLDVISSGPVGRQHIYLELDAVPPIDVMLTPNDTGFFRGETLFVEVSAENNYPYEVSYRVDIFTEVPDGSTYRIYRQRPVSFPQYGVLQSTVEEWIPYDAPLGRYRFVTQFTYNGLVVGSDFFFFEVSM